jgi:hypothetical protein
MQRAILGATRSPESRLRMMPAAPPKKHATAMKSAPALPVTAQMPSTTRVTIAGPMPIEKLRRPDYALYIYAFCKVNRTEYGLPRVVAPPSFGHNQLLYCTRARMTLTRSASEGVWSLPRWRFGLVWNVPFLTVCSIISLPKGSHRFAWASDFVIIDPCHSTVAGVGAKCVVPLFSPARTGTMWNSTA